MRRPPGGRISAPAALAPPPPPRATIRGCYSNTTHCLVAEDERCIMIQVDFLFKVNTSLIVYRDAPNNPSSQIKEGLAVVTQHRDTAVGPGIWANSYQQTVGVY